MRTSRMLCLAAFAAATAALHTSSAIAVDPVETTSASSSSGVVELRGSSASTPFKLALYKSTVLSLPAAIRQVSIGNPGVADVLVLRSDQLYVVGKALGTTNVVAWDAGGRVVTSFDVEVTHDLETLKSKLHQLLPGEKINVQSAQEKLILSGEVANVARVDAAMRLAGSFLPDCITAQSDAGAKGGGSMQAGSSCKKGEVVNLMQVGGAQQVMLKVTVAEMARSVVKKLDANLNILNFGKHLSGGAVSGGASFPNALDPNGLLTPLQGSLSSSSNIVGPALDMFEPATPTIDSTGAFLSYLSGDLALEAVLDISRRNGLAKILSEPTLTTLTGREAQFLSGGEFPIPVPQGGSSGGTTVEFKEFGVALRFVPLVLDSGRINMTLNVSVSDVSTDNSVVLRSAGVTNAFVIPSLTKRSASGTVELGDGQSLGIAGLINDNLRTYVSKFPGLGDLPLLGALFRSQEYVSGKSELVIFVTPHLAKPIAASQIRLPTDGFVAPRDYEFYLLGRNESKSSSSPRSAAPNMRVGHDVQPSAGESP